MNSFLSGLRRVPWMRILGMLGNVVAWMLEQLGSLVITATKQFFGFVAKGGITATLAKSIAVLLLLGLLAGLLQLPELARALWTLTMLPIALLALWTLAKSPFPTGKKKKKKKK